MKNLLRGMLVLSLVVCLSHIAWAKAEKISLGKKVVMNYTTKINGQVIETTEKNGPVSFIVGDGKIVLGLVKKLEGLKKGDKKTITLTPEEGYGKVIKEAIKIFPRSVFAKDAVFTKGQIIQLRGADQQLVSGIIRDVNDEKVLIDFNHPYAGQTLQIDVEVVDVQ